MADFQSRVPSILQDILRQTELTRNEICCKLREVIAELGGGTSTQATIYPGTTLLAGGTTSFSVATAPTSGTIYRSVSLTVISLTTGTVTVTNQGSTKTISYPNLTLGWSIDKASDGGLENLVITITGDAVVLVNYTTA